MKTGIRKASIQNKIILLLGVFLILTGIVFYGFFKSYLKRDKISSVKELQLLHVASASKDFESAFKDIRDTFTKNALKLIDSSRGQVKLKESEWNWLRAADREWKSSFFEGATIVGDSSVRTWGIQIDPNDQKSLLITEIISLLSGGEQKKVILSGSVKRSVLDQYVNNLEAQPSGNVILQSSFFKTKDKGQLWFQSSNAQNTFFEIFSKLTPSQKSILSEFGSPLLREFQVEGFGSVFFSWSGLSLDGSMKQVGLLSFITQKKVLGGFKSYIAQLIFWVLSILGLGIIVSSFFAKRLSAPIEDLVRATSQLQTGDFSVRVDASSNDEIGDLGRAFNHMGEALDDREKDLKNAQNALVQSEKMGVIGTMSAGIAHEVKNPLAGILGNAELANNMIQKLDGPEQVKLTRYLSIIQKETRRCKQIVDGLMRFSRQEKLKAVPTDLEVVCYDVMDLLEHGLRKNQVQLKTDFDTALWLVAGSSNQLQQVVLNMVQNASQAMGESGGEILVKTKYFQNAKEAPMGRLLSYQHESFQGAFCRVQITDNGSGMSEAFQKKIFEPFVTSKEAGKGTGLGLAVTMGILAEHQSRVSISSAEGEGTSFFLDFMAEKARSKEDTLFLQQRRAQSRGAGSPEMTVPPPGAILAGSASQLIDRVVEPQKEIAHELTANDLKELKVESVPLKIKAEKIDTEIDDEKEKIKSKFSVRKLGKK